MSGFRINTNTACFSKRRINRRTLEGSAILPHDNQQDTGERRKRWQWAIKPNCQRFRCGEPVNGFLQVKELDVEEQPLNLPALKGRSETGNGKTACLEAQIKLTKQVPMGMLYKRGAVFWIKYYLNDRPIRESCDGRARPAEAGAHPVRRCCRCAHGALQDYVHSATQRRVGQTQASSDFLRSLPPH